MAVPYNTCKMDTALHWYRLDNHRFASLTGLNIMELHHHRLTAFADTSALSSAMDEKRRVDPI
eukprot:5969159-Amphidinium_carterae.1